MIFKIKDNSVVFLKVYYPLHTEKNLLNFVVAGCLGYFYTCKFKSTETSELQPRLDQ